jgi:hypothetical protein
VRTTRTQPVSRQCDQASETLAFAHVPTLQLRPSDYSRATTNDFGMRPRKLLLHPPP